MKYEYRLFYNTLDNFKSNDFFKILFYNPYNPIFQVVTLSLISDFTKDITYFQIQNKYLVEGMDLVVKYNLFNIGDAAAVDIQMTENGFGVDDFDIVGGQAAIKFDRLAPGANTTHALVLRPTKFGYFNFTSAEVKYRASEEEDSPIKFGFSSEPGQGVIIALKDYDRQFSAHTVSLKFYVQKFHVSSAA